jgi:hypothetical protein
MTLLSGMLHARRTDPRIGQWLAELSESSFATDPYSDSGTIIRQLKREYDKRIKLPQSLVEELARLAARLLQGFEGCDLGALAHGSGARALAGVLGHVDPLAVKLSSQGSGWE